MDSTQCKAQKIHRSGNFEVRHRSAHWLLGSVGCEIDSAQDGQEALTFRRTIGYDVIVADIRLPPSAFPLPPSPFLLPRRTRSPLGRG